MKNPLITLVIIGGFMFSASLALGQQVATASDVEYGTIEDVKGLSKIFVRSDDDDARTTINRMLSGYEGLQVVQSAKLAEIVLEYGTLTRDVAANRGPYAHGASMALKSQMRAYITRPDGARVVAWTETETFDVTNGFVLGASNEMNLTQHFVRDLQKARGEKTYSLRKLLKNRPRQPKPSELKPLDPPFGEYDKKPTASPSP